MANARAKRLILFCSVLLSVLIVVVPLCRAENNPDISKLDTTYFLKNNQQFFRIHDSGYLLVSTDSVKETLITCLTKEGKADGYANNICTSIPFPYSVATLAGDELYLAGKSPERESLIKIAKFQIQGCWLSQNIIDGVNCDFTRGMPVKAGGTFFLVTVPYGSPLDGQSPFWKYVFHTEHEGAQIVGVPVSDINESSVPEESSSTGESSAPSEASSSLDSSSSAEPSSGSSSAASSRIDPQAPDSSVYYFRDGQTVEVLQRQLDAEGRGAKVRVTAADGTILSSGNIGTGATVEVLRGGQVESRVTAVIPGDLTGVGSVTVRDSVLLYEYITKQKQLAGLSLKAADINGDEKIDTSDMLEIKKRIK